jgi:flagellar biosynthesis protein FlhF
MNVRRFVAATSREALRQVREALGGDAVILANRGTPTGVEILAAASEEVVQLAMSPQAKVAQPQNIATPEVEVAPAVQVTPVVKPEPAQRVITTADLIVDAQTARARKRLVPAAPPEVSVPSSSTSLIPTQTDKHLAEEMRSMRGFIEEQIASLAWTETMRKQPIRMKLFQDMLAAGFSPVLSRHLQRNLPEDFSPEQAQEWLAGVLEKNLACNGPSDDLIDQSGVYALVGPTGVGKTTTIAKLAARFAVRHGADKLALITTDGYRIGAQDQLRIYGKILGVAVHTIQDEASLASAIQYLGQKRLVLIDTAGMGQRDQRVTEQIAMLRGAQAKRLLVLNATVQAETLDDVVQAYGPNSAEGNFIGCVISKLDEAIQLGGVLDVIIRHRMRVHYVSNGQRVPEDLHHPNSRYLVHRALKEVVRNPAFALQEEDYPAWLGAVGRRARATVEVSHV